jgi:hypothetical protein
MEGSEGAGCESDGDEKEDAGTEIFRYADEYNQFGVDIPKLRSMERSGGAIYESGGNEFEDARTGISFYIDEYE